MKPDSRIWLRLMLLAFAANGLGPFGLKVLDEAGLPAWFQQYLLYWYSGGLVFALAAFLGSKAAREFPAAAASPPASTGRRFVIPAEIILGAAMGLSSLSGQGLHGPGASEQTSRVHRLPADDRRLVVSRRCRRRSFL